MFNDYMFWFILQAICKNPEVVIKNEDGTVDYNKTANAIRGISEKLANTKYLKPESQKAIEKRVSHSKEQTH